MSVPDKTTAAYAAFGDYVETLKGQSFSKDAPRTAAIKKKALARFETLGLPHRKTESWKYVPLTPVLNRSYGDPLPVSEALTDIKEFSGSAQNELRLVFVDGTFREDLSTAQNCAEIEVSPLSQSLEEDQEVASRLEFEIENETNPFALLNTAALREGTRIQIRRNASLKETLHIYHINRSPQAVYAARCWFDAGAGSQVNVLCTYLALPESRAFSNDLCEIRLEENARLNWINVQKMEGESSFISSSRVYLERGSRFERIGFSSGGTLIRNDERVELLDESAFCSLSGLAILSGTSQAFNKVIVNHRSPGCVSRQFYKNILADRAIAEFNSLARVFENAQKSDSSQLNKNLLLSNTAQAFSRPKLMIYADDVTASHGSATGQPEEQELFYLRSRGIDRDYASYLLAFGFAEEILEQIHLEKARLPLENYVQAELHKMMGRK